MKFQHILASRLPNSWIDSCNKVRRHSTAFQSSLRGGAEAEKKFRRGLVGDVPEEKELCELYTSPGCLFFALPICSVSVDIGMLISECGNVTN